MENKTTIMIADSDAAIRNTIRNRFEQNGYVVFQASNLNEVFSQLESNPEVSVVIAEDQFNVLNAFHSKDQAPKVIIATGSFEKNNAMEAFRLGAYDYFEKPLNLETLFDSVQRAHQEYQMAKKKFEFVSHLEARIARVEGKTEDQFWFVSKAKSMESVNEWLRVLQKESMRSIGNPDFEDPNCLIQGAQGTGKEGIARMIHAGSKRAKGPWIAVNCSYHNSESLENELFGFHHEKQGLFELAQGGTLFLDEVAGFSTDLQEKIFQVLQKKTFKRVHGNEEYVADFRLICSSSVNLSDSVQQGTFVENFYHRISKVIIELPELSAREEDIVPMSDLFFERAFINHGKKYGGMSEEARKLFQAYSWPGNVRELLNVVERTVLLWNKTGAITPADVIIGNTSTHHSPTPPKKKYEYNDGYHPRISMNIADYSSFSQTYTVMKKKWSEVFEREYLVNVLHRTNGNVTAAAKESGIDRSNFLRLLRRHGIQSEQFRKVRDLKEAA